MNLQASACWLATYSLTCRNVLRRNLANDRNSTREQVAQRLKREFMTHDTDAASTLRRYLACISASTVLLGIGPAYANDLIDASNCMGHLGGGGLADFDCYESHAKSLEADNKRLAASIRSTHGTKVTSKARLDRYMRTQDESIGSCDLASELAYDWDMKEPPHTHVDMYDVMEARCHYSIRKQQNDFLRDLNSIKTGE